MWSAIKIFLEALFASGPVGIVAGICFVAALALGGLYWYKHKENKDLQEEIKTVLKSKTEELQKLNERYEDAIADLSDKRVDDLKELSSDYHVLASNTLQTLDRLVLSLELRRGNHNKE